MAHYSGHTADSVVRSGGAGEVPQRRADLLPPRERLDDGDHQGRKQRFLAKLRLGTAGERLGHLIGQAAHTGRQGDAGLLKEARCAAGRPIGAELDEPVRLDVWREDDRARAGRVVCAVMRLPRIDQHRVVAGERDEAIAHHKLRVCPSALISTWQCG